MMLAEMSVEARYMTRLVFNKYDDYAIHDYTAVMLYFNFFRSPIFQFSLLVPSDDF